MASNPYTLVFGREPLQLIPRPSAITQIVDSFEEEQPSQQVFLVSGVHGSGKTVLITVDEVASTQAMREFSAAYQILIRKDLPVFLLMTGLYDNIRKLQDERTLTFLYRAPRIEMGPLNMGIIADNYHKTLGLSKEGALELAKQTKGYPFAFQVFGYFAWRRGTVDDTALAECKQYLDDYAYDKIWSELSEQDRRVARAIALSPTSAIRDMRGIAHMSTNQFNPYRDRLIKKGIVDGSTYGHVSFTLPLFDRYVLEHS